MPHGMNFFISYRTVFFSIKSTNINIIIASQKLAVYDSTLCNHGQFIWEKSSFHVK